jgi:hypothetical protein
VTLLERDGNRSELPTVAECLAVIDWTCEPTYSGRLAAAAWLLLLACWDAPLEAAAPASPAAGRPAQSAANVDETDERRKQQLATAGVFLMVLVLLAGGGLLLMVILWGRRVRRTVRKPSPPASPGDELWYLRPNKQDGGTSPPAHEPDRSPPGKPPTTDGE